MECLLDHAELQEFISPSNQHAAPTRTRQDRVLANEACVRASDKRGGALDLSEIETPERLSDLRKTLGVDKPMLTVHRVMSTIAKLETFSVKKKMRDTSTSYGR